MLESVTRPLDTLQELSLTLVWLFDVAWAQLLEAAPSQAAESLLCDGGLLDACQDVLDVADRHYNLVALLPILRHFVFLEEYVCRRALNVSVVEDRRGNSHTTWRFESMMRREHEQNVLRLGMSVLPLGERSRILYPKGIERWCHQRFLTELQHIPLYASPAIPPADANDSLGSFALGRVATHSSAARIFAVLGLMSSILGPVPTQIAAGEDIEFLDLPELVRESDMLDQNQNDHDHADTQHNPQQNEQQQHNDDNDDDDFFDRRSFESLD
jgi:hypothetical protein